MKEADKRLQLRYDIEEYSDMILRIAAQNTKNYCDAQDIAQEVFMKLMDKYDTFRDSVHKKAWLIRVTLNLCHDAVRRDRFSAFLPTDNSLTFVEGGYENYELMDMIRRLSENQRNALYLHIFEGFSIDEIAEITGRNPRTVGSDIHRAKKRLKLEFDE